MALDKLPSILYVDDDKVSLFTFEHTFSPYYTVHTVGSAYQGLALLREKEIQLVITDQRMPITSGIEFLEQVAHRYPFIARIILTAFTDREEIIDAINKGRVYSYITKPWEKDDLKLRIDNALRARHLGKENTALLAKLQKSNEELVLSQQKFSLAFYAAPSPVSITNFIDGRFIDVNRSYELLTGYAKDELIGTTTTEIGLGVNQDQREEANKLMLREGKLFNFPYKVWTKAGQIKYTTLSSEVITVDGEKNILSLYLDITKEKRDREKIMAAVIETEDRERRRIANELHDSLEQRLTIASLNLSTIKSEVEQMSKKARSKWEIAMNSLKAAMNESRNISDNLMPKAIEDHGLVVAIENMLEGLKNSTKLEFDFGNNLLDQRLEPSLELGLFRITREAINNIIKHAKAKKVNLQATKFTDLIILTIEDDGKGFDTQLVANQGFGLNCMKVRTEALSGTFNIDSRVGFGTAITVQIPQLETLDHE